MNKRTEKALDKAIEDAFKTSHEFANWFLSKTKFADKAASYLWSRSDNPWGRIPLTIRNPKSDAVEEIIRESETDILVVFQTNDFIRFALHIENKLAGGKFTPLQPELYAERAKLWLQNPKYKEYTDYETVLLAPIHFHEKWIHESKKFGCYISHEDIAKHVPAFQAS